MPSTTQLWDVNIGTKPEGQIEDGAFPSSQFGSGTAFGSYRHAVSTVEFVSFSYITSNTSRHFDPNIGPGARIRQHQGFAQGT